jgi:hypothetical protein
LLLIKAILIDRSLNVKAALLLFPVASLVFVRYGPSPFIAVLADRRKPGGLQQKPHALGDVAWRPGVWLGRGKRMSQPMTD